MKRTRYVQKLELAAISPADMALWETTARYGQTAKLRARALVQLMRLRRAKR